MKDLYVIFFGQTQMTDVVGVYHQEVRDTHLAKTFQSNLTIQMILSWSLEPINW